MKTNLITLLLAASLSFTVANDSTLDDIKKVYELKKAEAVKPIEEWYARALEEYQQKATKAGNLTEAVNATKLAMAVKLCNKEWTWAAKARPDNTSPISFLQNGTGRQKYFEFTWSADPDGTIILTKVSASAANNGKQATFKLNATNTALVGVDFDGKTDAIIKLVAK